MTAAPRRVRFFAALIRALSRLAPSWRRDTWRDEWLGELWATTPPPSTAQLAIHTLGALTHIVSLWQREWSLTMLTRDITFAVRTLIRRPGFTATALVTLSLAIGASTAIFTLVNAVLLRPLPYKDSSRIVVIWPGTTIAPAQLTDATASRGAFEAIGGYSGWGLTITGGGQAEILRGARVTPSLFAVLGTAPLEGRVFRDDDLSTGGDHVVVISAGLAARRFGGARSALGQGLIIDGKTHRVIGVMPASFAFPDSRSDAWVPLSTDPSQDGYRANFISLLGRLNQSTSVSDAQSRMRSYAEELNRQQPKQFTERFLQRAVVVPLQNRIVRDVRTPLLLVFGAVGVLLLIACANVGNLLLGQAASRQTEVAVRAALGAQRGRVIRQLLVESTLLASLGSVGGIVIAQLLVGLFVPLVPADLPHIALASIDWRVLAFTAALTAACALFFGLLPALQLSRADVRSVLSASRGSAHAHGSRRMRTALVIVEVSLATVLVVAASLLGRSFIGLLNAPLGFDANGVLTLRVSAPAARYDEPEKVIDVFDRLMARISAVPGVEHTGAIQLLPLTPDNWNPGVIVEGMPPADQYALDVNWRLVTPDYLSTMRVPIVSGRSLTSADSAASTGVALINSAFAKAVFKGANPIGRRIRTGFEEKDEWVEIVGVVGDVRQHTIERQGLPEMYRPFAQHPLTTMRVMVRTSGDPAPLSSSVRAAVAAVDPDLAIADMEPMARVVDRALGGSRFPMMLAALFAVAAVTLGIVGVAGILAADAAAHKQEIGIRIALGASTGSIERRFVLRGLRVAAIGVAVGIGAALYLTRGLQSMLYGISPTDPLTLAGVSAGFMALVLIAAYVPARRASRVDPLLALRAD